MGRRSSSVLIDMVLRTVAQIFIEYVPRKPGFMEEYLFSLSTACIKMGTKLIVVFPDAPADSILKAFDRIGINVFVLPSQSGPNSIRFFLELMRLVRKERIELVDFHFGSDVALAFIAASLRIFNRGVIVVRHQHNRYERRKHAAFVQRRISRAKIACLLAHRVIAVSEAVKRDLLAHSIPETKVAVVQNGINVSRYQPSEEGARKIRKEFGFAEDIPVITAIAYACPRKGLGYLLEALPKVLEEKPSAKVLIVGGGPLTEALKKQASELGITESVIFGGARSDIPEILAATDVSVLPSLSEGMPAAILEAMSCARPVVASNLDEISEIVKDGETGFLVPPRNPGKIAEAITRLLKDEQLAKQIGKNGQKMVRDRFSVETMIENTLRVYGQLAQTN